jgi:hypothetical protein
VDVWCPVPPMDIITVNAVSHPPFTLAAMLKLKLYKERKRYIHMTSPIFKQHTPYATVINTSIATLLFLRCVSLRAHQRDSHIRHINSVSTAKKARAVASSWWLMSSVAYEGDCDCEGIASGMECTVKLFEWNAHAEAHLFLLVGHCVCAIRLKRETHFLVFVFRRIRAKDVGTVSTVTVGCHRLQHSRAASRRRGRCDAAVAGFCNRDPLRRATDGGEGLGGSSRGRCGQSRTRAMGFEMPCGN